jgi:hypothetical protein
MKVGEKITFPFATGTKEGIIEKVTAKKVTLRVDFPHHPRKRIVRSIAALEAGAAGSKKKKETKKKEKQKEQKKQTKKTQKKEQET